MSFDIIILFLVSGIVAVFQFPATNEDPWINRKICRITQKKG